MVIAIDYDGTITRDIKGFAVILIWLLMRKHTVVIITQRSEEQGDDVVKFVDELKPDHDVPIVWSSGKAKQVAAIEAGYFVDVWVEDNPLSIFEPLVYVGNRGELNDTENRETD